jgi:uncharacterized protein (TIGR03435 family)
VLLSAIGALNPLPIPAQPPPTRFDVATIKLNAGTSMGARTQPLPGGRLRVENQPLRALIKTAYKVQDFQLSGGPGWIASGRYDIEAKSEGNPPLLEVVGPMLQALLEDRFKLKIHREIRELPVYALSVSKSGLKISPSEQGSCVPYDPNHAPQGPGPGQKRQSICGNVSIGKSMMNATSIRMEDLTKSVSYILGRTVIDKTEVKYTFDVHLEFVPDEAVFVGPPGAAGSSGPSIFTALREQLGLNLKSAKGPVEVLVIDNAEKPSAN